MFVCDSASGAQKSLRGSHPMSRTTLSECWHHTEVPAFFSSQVQRDWKQKASAWNCCVTTHVCEDARNGSKVTSKRYCR